MADKTEEAKAEAEKKFVELFQSFDKDSGGTLDAEEVLKALASCGVKVSKTDLDKFMKDVDDNNDGKLSQEEFVKFATSDREMGGMSTLLMQNMFGDNLFKMTAPKVSVPAFLKPKMRILLISGPDPEVNNNLTTQIADHIRLAKLSVADIMKDAEDKSDEASVKAIGDRIKESDCGRGFILYDFPITPEQATLFDELLKKAGQSLECILLLETPESNPAEAAIQQYEAREEKLKIPIHKVPGTGTIAQICGKVATLVLPDAKKKEADAKKVKDDKAAKAAQVKAEKDEAKRVKAEAAKKAKEEKDLADASKQEALAKAAAEMAEKEGVALQAAAAGQAARQQESMRLEAEKEEAAKKKGEEDAIEEAKKEEEERKYEEKIKKLEESGNWEVEKVLNERGMDEGTPEYFVKWKYCERWSDNTWVTPEDLKEKAGGKKALGKYEAYTGLWGNPEPVEKQEAKMAKAEEKAAKAAEKAEAAAIARAPKEEAARAAAEEKVLMKAQKAAEEPIWKAYNDKKKAEAETKAKTAKESAAKEKAEAVAKAKEEAKLAKETAAKEKAEAAAAAKEAEVVAAAKLAEEEAVKKQVEEEAAMLEEATQTPKGDEKKEPDVSC